MSTEAAVTKFLRNSLAGDALAVPRLEDGPERLGCSAHHASQTIPPSKELAWHSVHQGWLRGKRRMALGIAARF
jgi:hypothetical protein